MKELINQVVKGELNDVNLPFTPIAEIEQILEDLEIEIDNDRETNGYQIDFWYYYKNRKYVLSGSLEWGGFNFSLNTTD